jgi:MFS family permease
MNDTTPSNTMMEPPNQTPSDMTPNASSPPGKIEEGNFPRGSYTPSDIERLGRERPSAFRSLPHELGFCFALLGSMFVAEYMISGFNILLPDLTEALHIPSNAQTWPASVFSLVTGAFLLPFGRLADMFGGYLVFCSGLAWFLIWSIIAGFSQNYVMHCRALGLRRSCRVELCCWVPSTGPDLGRISSSACTVLLLPWAFSLAYSLRVLRRSSQHGAGSSGLDPSSSLS